MWEKMKIMYGDILEKRLYLVSFFRLKFKSILKRRNNSGPFTRFYFFCTGIVVKICKKSATNSNAKSFMF